MVRRGKIQDRDRGLKKLMRHMKQARGMEVRVGVLGKKAAEPHEGAPELTNVDVARFHEFGLGVPKRSFLRETAAMNDAKIKRNIGRASEMVIEGQHPRVVLSKFGLWFEGVVKKRIASGKGFKPLAQSTIERKGSSKPLIDTGQLRNSVTSEVVK